MLGRDWEEHDRSIADATAREALEAARTRRAAPVNPDVAELLRYNGPSHPFQTEAARRALAALWNSFVTVETEA